MEQILIKPKRKNRKKKALPRIFEVVQVEAPAWKRTFVSVREWSYRLACIQNEDFVTDPKLAMPVDPYDKAVWYSRTFSVAQDGDYELALKSGQQMVSIRVDGKVVLDLIQPVTTRFRSVRTDVQKTKAIHLTKGNHNLEIVLFNEMAVALPDLTLRSLGPGLVPQSLWDLNAYSLESGGLTGAGKVVASAGK